MFTGQHPVDPVDYRLEAYPAVRLDCPAGGDPHAHAGAVAEAVLPLLSETGLLVVQGDTSSALGAALAAARCQVPLGHVEAGLRSHDRRRPWPEEEFRVAIDAMARLLFAPTELSAANLRRERVSGSIHVTGNSGIDAVLRARRELGAMSRIRAAAPNLLVTCHRRESWDIGLAEIAGALRLIAEQQDASIDLLLHPNPATAAHVRALLLGCDGVTLHPPLGHVETIAAMLAADCVLSDSGGIQEECAALGIPLLVLRDRTERPEAIACGKMTLVGTDPERIVDAVRAIGKTARPPSPASRDLPYGNGQAGERIATIVGSWLRERGGSVTSADTRRPAARGPRVDEHNAATASAC